MARSMSPARRARLAADRLAQHYPGSAAELCALRFTNPFELLVATILSAQCTDERVNIVTPAVFERYGDPLALARAEPAELEAIIRSTGFFRAKAASLIAMAQALVSAYGGEVPEELDELVTLAGVGRKTGNVVRSVAFGLPGLPVDTHVGRLSRRLGLTGEEDPVKVERDLCGYLRPEEWGAMSLRLILLGREICTARKPRCGDCLLADFCPSAGSFAAVASVPGPGPGRKRASARVRATPAGDSVG